MPPPGDDVDRGRGATILAVVHGLLTGLARAGRASATGAVEAVEAPCRALARKIATGAIAQPRPVADESTLTAALAQRPAASALGGATGAALLGRMARKFGPLRVFARRTPTWLVIVAVPALHASVTRGAEELNLIASHLAHKAHLAGVQPDPDRLRRAAVQVMSGLPIDPNREPSHSVLAGAWLKRALRSTMPFSHGIVTNDPRGLATAAAAVDPATLGGPGPQGPPALDAPSPLGH